MLVKVLACLEILNDEFSQLNHEYSFEDETQSDEEVHEHFMRVLSRSKFEVIVEHERVDDCVQRFDETTVLNLVIVLEKSQKSASKDKANDQENQNHIEDLPSNFVNCVEETSY